MVKKGGWIAGEFDEKFGDGIISFESEKHEDGEDEDREKNPLMRIKIIPNIIIITDAWNVRRKQHPPLLPQIIS